MPRKAKEEKSEIEVKQVSKVAPKTTKTEKKTSTKVSATTTNKVTAKKTATKSAKNSNIIKKVVDSITPKKKKTPAKKTATKSTKKAVKTLTKESIKSTEKNEVAKKPTTISGEEFSIAEYYDLPYRYNQTIVKLLAQTPTTLFVYWDISDFDRENLKKNYGYDFFEKTRPILIVHNDTMNYSFEVEINDFANSWYLHVNDSNCDYRIELGRRPVYNYIPNNNFSDEVLQDKNSDLNKYPSKPLDRDYFYITTSNSLESPNDHILFNKFIDSIQIRNVKTNVEYSKSITSMSVKNNMNKIYNIFDLYKKLYKEENIEDIYDLANPSSGNFSSQFK